MYELLADESAAVRHAVAELVAAMLEEQGEAVIKVGPLCRLVLLDCQPAAQKAAPVLESCSSWAA